MAVWLAARWLISVSSAARQVRLAGLLDEAPPVLGEGVDSGAVNLEQAQRILAVLRDVPAEYAGEAAGVLVEAAGYAQPEELSKAGAHLVAVVAPEAVEQAERKALERAEQRAERDRYLSLSDDATGVAVHGRLTIEQAAVVRAALDPLCAPLPDDHRSPGQRRVDALEEVCRLALSTQRLPDNGGDRPQIVVTIDYDLLLNELGAGTLDDGHRVTPEAARRMACDARITPAVLNTTGVPLDVGRTHRLFSGPLRRALVLRDRGCAWPGCDRPARWTHGHHIIGWHAGGDTALHNAVLLCGHHHREIHRPNSWTVYIAPDGLPTFIPPAWVDPERKPRRNTRHHRRE